MGFLSWLTGEKQPKQPAVDVGLENRQAADSHYERMMAKAREDQNAAEQMGIDKNPEIVAGMAEEGVRQMRGEGQDHGNIDLKAGKPDAMQEEYKRVAAEQQQVDQQAKEAARKNVGEVVEEDQRMTG